jgi:hypothetical protein
MRITHYDTKQKFACGFPVIRSSLRRLTIGAPDAILPRIAASPQAIGHRLSAIGFRHSALRANAATSVMPNTEVWPPGRKSLRPTKVFQL